MISYPFLPNPSAGAFRTERLTKGLADLGWEIEIVTIGERFDAVKQENLHNRLPASVTVNRTSTLDPWLWLQQRNTRNVALRILRSMVMAASSFPDHMTGWIPFAVSRGLKIHRKKKIDAIYTTSPPHSTHMAGHLLSSLTGLPWVADFRDPWTTNAFSAQEPKPRVLAAIERALEKAVFNRASYVFANTRANLNILLQANPGLPPEKVVFLPNGWDPFPDDVPTGGKHDAFTILHAGAFYPRFKPFALLDAVAEWRRRGPSGGAVPQPGNLKIVLLGCSDPAIRDRVERLGIGDLVEMLPQVPRAEARRRMLESDILWVTLGTGKASSTYIPSKLLEYIASGKPILGFFPQGEAASMITSTGTGKVFTRDDPDPIIGFLADAVTDKKQAIGKIFHPLEDVKDTYRMDRVVERLDDILRRLI